MKNTNENDDLAVEELKEILEGIRKEIGAYKRRFNTSKVIVWE